MLISKMGCFIVLLLTVLSMHHYYCEGCHAVSEKDALIAMQAATQVYELNYTSVGTTITNTSFVIQKVIALKHMGEPLKALVARDDGTTIVAFQGTKTAKQLLQEFRAALDSPIKVEFNKTVVGVMPFFWEAFEKFDAKMLIPKPNNKEKYILTGHSLGGALAAILAIYARTQEGLNAIWMHPESSLVTFGEPRVGDYKYAALHDKYISVRRKLRFVNERDIVPHVPPHFLGYYHHSREVWIRSKKKRWWWFGPKDIFWIVCPFNDEAKNSCSNDLHLRRVSQHSSSIYLETLSSKPKGFVDRFKKVHKTFQEALCA